jgi:homocitrate synthase
LKPEDFGVKRFVHIAHRLTGWNAVKNRVEQLGLNLTDDEIKDATAKIKTLADIKAQTLDDVDALLRQYHENKAENQSNGNNINGNSINAHANGVAN